MSPVVHLKSSAKINLTLDILGRDERVGKHFVNTILYRVDSMQDELFLTRRDDDENRVHCDYPGIPKGNLNTVVLALESLNEKGWDVKIKKQIPTQAGLGGGSGNAAAILKYFGEKKRLPEEHLHDLAKQIGADVPFFLLDENLAYAEGFGDQIVQSWQIDPLEIELMPSGVKVSTVEAYAGLDPGLFGMHSAQTEALLQILNKQQALSTDVLKPYIHNDFESSFFKQFPILKGQGNLCGSGGMLWKLKEL
jgi:4-diphosphocytidyl-2-C-methyl-D-erythritol kinase